MEYFVCNCGMNYVFIDLLCQIEVIERLEDVIGEALNLENGKAEESLAVIKMVLGSIFSISKHMPDFGESYVKSLDMDVPADADEVSHFLPNPLLKDVCEYIESTQHIPHSLQSNDCEKCKIIGYNITIILSFGFFLLGMRRYHETEMIKKIIYLLSPFRRKHVEIQKYYDLIWKLTLEGNLCYTLYNHIVIFHCQPLEVILTELINNIGTMKISISMLKYNAKYRDLLKISRKSRKTVCYVAERIVDIFIECQKLIWRDFLTLFVDDLRETVVPSTFVKLFSDNLCPFAAFVVQNYKDKKVMHHYIKILKSQDYKKYIELGISYEKFHFLTNEMIEK